MNQTPKYKFQVQRWHAVHARNIEWNLTFDEWMNWWLETGHWEDRGVGIGKYCMSRIGDKGAYELGNIECKLSTENSRETMKNNPKIKEKLKGHVPWNKGQKTSPETRAKLSAAQKNRPPKSAEHRQRISDSVRRQYAEKFKLGLIKNIRKPI